MTAWLLCLGCLSVPVEPPQPGRKPLTPADRVNELMRAMRDGDFQGGSFPDLGWEHVPALVERSRSRARLRSVPTNPLSSFIPREAREGEVALWLVEGVRRGGRYPSLAPALRGAQTRGHEKAVHAYLRWWRSAARSPRARGEEPLRGTGLSWY